VDRIAQIRNETLNIQTRLIALEEMGVYDNDEIYQLEDRYGELMGSLPENVRDEIMESIRNADPQETKSVDSNDDKDKIDKKEEEAEKKIANSSV